MKKTITLVLAFTLLTPASYAENEIVPVVVSAQTKSVFGVQSNFGTSFGNGDFSLQSPFGAQSTLGGISLSNQNLNAFGSTSLTGYTTNDSVLLRPQIKSEIADVAFKSATEVGFAAGIIHNATNIEHELGEVLGSIQCRGGKADVTKCSDFKGTPVEGASFIDLARLYVLKAPNLASGLFGFLKTSCEDCFPEKYSMLTSQTPDNEEKLKEFKTEAKSEYSKYVELKSREKALTSFSEFAKMQERRNAFTGHFGTIGTDSAKTEACKSGANFKLQVEEVRKRYGCVDDAVIKKRMTDIQTALNLPGADASDPENFFDNLNGKISDSLSYLPAFCPVSPLFARVSYNREVNETFTKENVDVFGQVTGREPYKSQFARCAEANAQCLQDVLLKFLREDQKLSEVDALRRINVVYMANPFLRVLVTSKQGWLTGTRLTLGAGSPEEDITKNKAALLEMFHADQDAQCTNYQNDLALSLCLKEENAYGIVSPVKMRLDLNAEIEKIAKDPALDQIEKNKRTLKLMGAACQSTQVNGSVDINSRATLFAHDQNPDSLNYADVIFRNKITLPPGGMKSLDLYGAFADKSCSDTRMDQLLSAGGDAGGGVLGGTNSYLGGSKRNYLPVSVSTISTESLFKVDTDKMIADLRFTPITIDPALAADTRQKLDAASGNEAGKDKTGTASGNTKESTTSDVTTTDKLSKEVKVADTKTATVAPGATSVTPSGATGVTPSVTGQAGYYGSTSSTWRGPAGQSDRDVSDVEPVIQPKRASISSPTSLQQAEDLQATSVAQIMSQTTQIQNLQTQKQLEEMRLEMEQLRQSNRTLLASIKKTSAAREQRGETNAFDTPEVASSEENSGSSDDVVPETTPRVKTNGGVSGRVETPVVVGSTSGITGSGVAVSPVGGASAGTSGTPDVVVSNSAGRGVVITSYGGGAATTSGYGSRGVAGGGSSFAPSLTLQQTLGTTTEGAPALAQDQKIELLREFLSFVEKNPDYRSGSYLSNNNDQVTIDYGGRVFVVKVEDISDEGLRTQLQERLLRQRVILNQQTRDKRLENLRRLLAQARGATEP